MNRFVVMKLSPDGVCQTMGPAAILYGSMDEASKAAKDLARRYPDSSFLVFERAATYASETVVTVRS